MSVTALHVIAKRDLEPIAQIGDNVAVMRDPVDESRWVYGEVVFLEPLLPKAIDLVNYMSPPGSIPAASTTMYPFVGPVLDISRELFAGRDEMLQLRFALLDDFGVILYQPRGISRSNYLSGPTPLTRIVPPMVFAEFFVFETEVIFVQPMNFLFTPLSTARIAIAGFRYLLRRLQQRPQIFTRIPVAGVAPTPPAAFAFR
jgi:hypothetical protein